MGPSKIQEARMQRVATDNNSSSTATRYQAGRTLSSNTGTIPIRVTRAKPEHQRSSKSVEAAVYGFVRAVRALGKTQINTADIAKALGLPVSKVDEVLPKLIGKGIRRAG
jgi:hypothetical protein